MEKANNYAYIDSANLHNALLELGWQLDYRSFYIWLTEKYSVTRAYIFIGLIPKYKDLYIFLQECGFELIFKEVVYDGLGKAKGNCDADLVLQAVRDAYEQEFDKAVIVSSDGDYASLIKFLLERNQLHVVLSPSINKKCSILIKRTNARISYLNDQRGILEAKNKKAPNADETA